MKRSSWKKRLGRAALVSTGIVAGLVALTAARQDRTFDAPFPDVHASTDPAVIARGHYLVTGPAHCADCHGEPGQGASLETGEEVPLAGGKTFHLPVGTFVVPNITPDPKSGIGRYEDREIARMLRHGVRPDGHAVLPFMRFNDLTDDDLGAVISYLRSRPPVSRDLPEHRVNTAGRIMKAWVLEPRGPLGPVPKSIEPGPTAAYGRYLANNVANCVTCHTKVDLRTGAFDGPLFGGGASHASTSDPNKKFVTPNLTPDPTWGWIAEWSEDVFVARMKVGKVYPDSPMPWYAFKRMTDDDLRAIYRYLRTLPPAAGGPDPSKRDAVVVAAANDH
jgi:mono/diheme cytochrome c family protein